MKEGVSNGGDLQVRQCNIWKCWTGVTRVCVCGVVLRQSSRACSSISGDVWPAHIALDGTQYVRSRKAITIRFRENCPIPNDTTGEYRENLYRSYSLSLLLLSVPPGGWRLYERMVTGGVDISPLVYREVTPVQGNVLH